MLAKQADTYQRTRWLSEAIATAPKVASMQANSLEVSCAAPELV